MSLNNLAQISLAFLIVAIVWCGISLPATGQTPLESHVITQVSFQNTDIRQVLQQLFKIVQVSYSVSPDVQGVVTVELQNVTFQVALQNVLRQVDATYRVNQGVYEVIHHQNESTDKVQTPDQMETADHFTFKNTDVREAIRRIFKASGKYYSIAPEVHGSVTLDVQYAPYEAVLSLILRQVYASYRVESGVYVIFSLDNQYVQRKAGYLKDAPAYGPVLPNKESSITQDARFLYVIRGTTLYKVQKSDLKVVKTGALDQVDIREALHELFSSVNASYTVDPQVQGSVTLDFKNVLFETALQQVLRQVGATYRIMDGTFQIVHKQDNIAPNYENPKP